MRPDLEDYEELQPTDEAPRSRAMSWLVLAIAVGGFAALAYYAYHSGTAKTEDGDLMVVQADESPIKEVPADPEGEQFANKDKTIYDVITPGQNGESGNVEQLLPEPEKPVLDAREAQAQPYTDLQPAPAASAPAPTTFVNKQAAKPATAVDPVDVQSLKQPAPAVSEAPAPAAAPVTSAPATAAAPAPMVTHVPQPQQAVIEPKPAVTPAAEPAGAPKFVNESTVATPAKKAAEPVKKAEAKPAPTKEVKKEAAKTEAKKPATGGSYQVQLGAYKSEAEAQGAWKKISGKFAGVLSAGPSIVKADLPNGTFYRLRTGGFASADAAKAACTKLAAAKQPCMPVGK